MFWHSILAVFLAFYLTRVRVQAWPSVRVRRGPLWCSSPGRPTAPGGGEEEEEEEEGVAPV